MANDQNTTATAPPPLDLQPYDGQQQAPMRASGRPAIRTPAIRTGAAPTPAPSLDLRPVASSPPQQTERQPAEKDAWGAWDPTGGALNDVGNALGSARDYLGRKADEYEHEREARVAAGGPDSPMVSGLENARQFVLGELGTTSRLGQSTVSPQGVATTAATIAAPEVMGPVLIGQGAYTAAKHAPGALRGEPEEVEQTLEGLSEAAGGGAATGAGLGFDNPAMEGQGLRARIGETNTGRAVARVGEGLSPITERFSVPEAPKALRQAIQPSVNIPRAGESIEIAGPRLQQLKQAGALTSADGEPIAEFKTPADLLEGIKGAKAHVWDAIEQRMGPVAQLQADTGGVGSAMRESISRRTAAQYPQAAAAIQRRAATYDGTMSLRDIENAIQDANNDLRNFYKRPSSTDSPVSPDMTATEAEVRALRSLLDEKVAKLSGNEDIGALKREYGALRDVERATAKANAVATRQKGATLWEGLAALRAAGDFSSGNVLSAAKGAGTLAIGRWLAQLRDPNFLIDQSFQGKKSFAPAGEIPAPAQRAPFRQLAAGPVQVGAAPDTSSVRGIAADAEPGTSATRRGYLLGTGEQFLVGAAPDTSGVRGIEAEPQPGTRALRRGLLLPEPGQTFTDVGRQAPGGPSTRPRPLEMPPTGDVIDIASGSPSNSGLAQGSGTRSMSRAERDDRIEMRNLSDKIKQFRVQGDRARTNEQVQNLRGKERAAQERLDQLRSKYAPDAGTPTQQSTASSPKRTIASEPKPSRTPTYDGMDDAEREWIDGYVNEIPHMPKMLQDSEMEELRKF
ncbi:MAG: hypothetical protein WAU89_10955, partial [Candidatus Acidiferrales bacterium]